MLLSLIFCAVLNFTWALALALPDQHSQTSGVQVRSTHSDTQRWTNLYHDKYTCTEEKITVIKSILSEVAAIAKEAAAHALHGPESGFELFFGTTDYSHRRMVADTFLKLAEKVDAIKTGNLKAERLGLICNLSKFPGREYIKDRNAKYTDFINSLVGNVDRSQEDAFPVERMYNWQEDRDEDRDYSSTYKYK